MKETSLSIKPEHLKIVKEILFKFIPDLEVWGMFNKLCQFKNSKTS